MSNSFIEVPAADIEQFLSARGFTRTICYQEVVYERRLPLNTDVVIKVYTSIRVGRNVARGNGRDSIKVATVFQNSYKSFGIGRFPHVHRVGDVDGVLTRMLERICDALERGNQWVKEQEARRGSWVRTAS
jgi:hypothetical protein